MSTSIPLYIHIPFCRKKCSYCDFYSIEYEEELARKYIEVLIKQIRNFKEKGYNFSTLYIGGGTPSVLAEKLLERLLKSLELSKMQEASFEANPESLSREKLKLLLELGINRLSVGVQSFDDKVLRFLARLHTSEEALKAISLAKEVGFENINVDLIYGVPNKDFNLWKKELELVVTLPIKHISLYSLTYEKSTPLFLRLRNREFTPISEEEEAQIYKYAVEYLEREKFFRYEVSNFSKRGYECRHNLIYWENAPYLGIGPSAVSYIEGVRKKYILDIYQYIEAIERGQENEIFIEKEELPPLKRAKETAVLNLRMRGGINFKEFKKFTGFDFLEIEEANFNRLLRERLLTFKRKDSKIYGVRLTKKGFLFYDYVSREFL